MIQLTIPVYYTKTFKTKPDKTFLCSLNWYRNAFHFEQNKVKQYFHDLITEQLKGAAPITGKYRIVYDYYYKNTASDLPNVTPMCSKWVNDTLQDLNLVKNDSVKYLVEEIHRAVAKDPIDPRCTIIIEEV
jgi:hypothetical protein